MSHGSTYAAALSFGVLLAIASLYPTQVNLEVGVPTVIGLMMLWVFISRRQEMIHRLTFVLLLFAAAYVLVEGNFEPFNRFWLHVATFDPVDVAWGTIATALIVGWLFHILRRDGDKEK